MSLPVHYEDLGYKDYKECWDYQETLFNRIMQDKRSEKTPDTPQIAGYLLFVEHPHVYTLGKSGDSQNMLITDELLEKINATYYKINRGGDITYHGPGQIVGYPIFDLERFSLGLKNYIYQLEEVIIRTLADYGISGERLTGATGVWLDTDDESKARKICAIGVRASKYVTMHGFAFNINTDLNYFNYINPCGFTQSNVTSLEKEMGEKIDIDRVKQKLREKFSEVFSLHFA